LGDEESANAHIVTTYLPAGMQLLTAHAGPSGDPHVEKLVYAEPFQEPVMPPSVETGTYVELANPQLETMHESQ
jgi:hypothetical protein